MTIEMNWRLRSTCQDYPPDQWFPERGGGEAAKKICINECPVRRECGQEAIELDERWAIAAGFRCSDSGQRNELRLWLGLPPLAADVRTCKNCFARFETRRPISICPGCRQSVDAGPVRQHLAALKAANVTYRQAAELAGVSPSLIKGLIHGSGGHPWRNIARDNAVRILAIPVPQRVSA
jgi:hypothetical protein